MTCRETLTLDLTDFLVRPTAPEFAAFREHYPRCADCATELRTWTELHASLATTTHPSPDTLLRYADARLTADDRRAVAQHLTTCLPCRDELRALAVFDRDAAMRAAPAVAERPRRLAELGRLFLHPALAYGLVLALLFYPALTGRQQPPEPSADRDHARPALAKSKLDDAGVVAPREEPAAKPETRALTQAPPSAPATSARAKAESAERENEGGVLSLGSIAQPRIDATGTGDTVTLEVPVRPSLRGAVVVRVVDERGERELRERMSARGEHVEMRVPRAWLLPGRYRVELQGTGAEEPEVFAFEVGR